MMDEEHGITFQRLVSDESESSVFSDDSYEYYHTEIFGLLPSSQARLGQQQKPDIQITDVQNERLLMDISVPLKALPVCMQEKRDVRKKRKGRHKIGYWESWRRSQLIAWRRLKEHFSSALTILLPWRQTLRMIKGQFGVRIKAYFEFLRYLLGLNLLYCIIISGSVLTPTLMFRHKRENVKVSFNVKDIFIGSGFLNTTPVFHSFYTSGSLNFDCLNTPILFLLCMASIFLFSIVVMVRRTVVGYKQVWLTGNRLGSTASFKVFCGWDFCIQNEDAAKLKHMFIDNDLKMDLEEQKSLEKLKERNFRAWVLVIFLRIVLNILVLVLLASSFALIYYSIDFSQNRKTDPPEFNNWLSVLKSLSFEYLPPITMMTVNCLLPHIFNKISEFEHYLPATQLNVTLIRSIFLKLASLGIYLFFLIRAPKHQDKCKENAFGKEMYKLIMFNFLEGFVSTFCLTFPRTLLVERFPSSSLLKKLNKPEFDITSNVLDLVNSQTVTWVGMFYCPLLPALSAVRLLLLFYLKKFTLTRCCLRTKRMFRTTSLSVLFHFTLCLGLIMSLVTLGVNIYRFNPGDCGPFEGNNTIFNVTDVCIKTLPGPVQSTIRYVSSEAFAYALILAEVVILTSYMSRARANHKAIEGLKDMLVMCSSDKRFLVKEHTTIQRQKQRKP
ncbi:transmembrane channel-like protein 7 [Paramisgurnus dabryanus]|uniref:transmembrane channel-like protein 7 n=1 Tax=Paramisgurnus dabryanus TaxID=90735 RepID=UPI0031F38F42